MKNVQPLVRAHCAAHNARLAWTPKESSSELHSLLSRTRQVLRDVCPVTSATWSASPKAKTLLASAAVRRRSSSRIDNESAAD